MYENNDTREIITYENNDLWEFVYTLDGMWKRLVRNNDNDTREKIITYEK